jgi:hypothetical protein
MKARGVMMMVVVAAASVATLMAVPQSGPQTNKQAITPDTGRFGDASATARKYQDYLYGVIKEMKPEELVLTQTKFGVDQTFKLNKKTKYTLDGKRSSYDKLKVGDRVYIDVGKDKRTGDMIAKKVVTGVDIPTLPSASL